MTLGKQDAELFYELWFPLLDFVNQKYRICPGVGTIDRSRGVDAADAKKIADYLWSHTQVLQEYLAQAKLPEEQAQIVAGWVQCKPGKYIMERHLKKGTVFISEDDQTVYMVKGLFSTWEEMLGKGPVLLDAVLIPFKDMIFRMDWSGSILSISDVDTAKRLRISTERPRRTIRSVFP